MPIAMVFFNSDPRSEAAGSVFKIHEDCESSGNADKNSNAKSIINFINRRGN